MAALKVHIVGPIDHNVLQNVLITANQLENPTNDPKYIVPTEIILRINSGGGDIAASIAIYNTLSSIKIPLITHNIGEVSSAANIIFLAGKERYACKHSYFRHHGSFFPVQGTQHRVVYEDAIETLKIGEEIMTSIIIERTNLTAQTVKKYFHTPTTISPDAALKSGIIHGIKEID